MANMHVSLRSDRNLKPRRARACPCSALSFFQAIVTLYLEKGAHFHGILYSLHPAFATLQMGLLFREGLALDEAKHYLERAAAADPTDATILSNLAGTLSRLGEFPRTMEVVDQAIKLVQKNGDCEFSL